MQQISADKNKIAIICANCNLFQRRRYGIIWNIEIQTIQSIRIGRTVTILRKNVIKMLGFGVSVFEVDTVDVKEGEKSKWFEPPRAMSKFQNMKVKITQIANRTLSAAQIKGLNKQNGEELSKLPKDTVTETFQNTKKIAGIFRGVIAP